MYEVWSVKGGKLDKLIEKFESYSEAWIYVFMRKNSGAYVVRYFNK